MKILFATSEVNPFVSTGGLADVSESLPKAIKKISGSDIRVILPYYESIKSAWKDKVSYIGNFTVTLAWRRLYCGIFLLNYDGINYYFLDNEYYFKRAYAYGEYDDAERFAFFSKAILDFMIAIDFFPDVLHANDWQTALSIPYLKKIYINDSRFSKIYTVFTIHNIMYQGRYGISVFDDILGLPNFSMQDLVLDSDINFMKGAIQTADRITTVSETYREELLKGENSYRMENALNIRASDFIGIVNGIDCNSYKLRTNKKSCKKDLQKKMCLKESDDTPVIAMVSRLCEQKGMSIIKPCLEEILKEDIQLVVLGKGEYMDEEFFKYLERIHPDKVRAHICFDREMSKTIYSGADILLMPSLSEPCGIAQMIACSYGTIPIVRETGGLKDTIKCYNPYCTEDTNGFSFYEYSSGVLKDTIYRALDLYKNKEEWSRLSQRAMETDFSWQKSALKYIEVYRRL
jgi:starch synthase